MNNKSLAMINLVYFSANFPFKFIHSVWPSYLADHLESKLLNFVSQNNKGYCDFNAFFHWFLSLSPANQKVLCDWIELNYHYNSTHLILNGSLDTLKNPKSVGNKNE